MFRGNHSLPALSRSLTRTALGVIFRLLLILVIGSVLLVLLLRWVPPPTSSLMIQRHFQSLGIEQQGNMAIHYRWVPFKAIAPPMALAVIAAEDQKFLGHRGFDFGSIKQALEDQAQGKRLRGASTISQQVAKNLFLWPGRSYLRKGLEAWFTLLMETLWPKQRILEVYLNIAELGEHTFGVEAASQRFFGKSAAQLSPQESALLAAVLPNPLSYGADAPSAYIRKRQDWILRQMGQLGGIGYLDNI